jgi:hypothetical protein
MAGLGSFAFVVFVVVDAATGPPLRLRACSLSNCVCVFSHVLARLRLFLLLALQIFLHPVPCVHLGHIWLAFALR